MSTVEIAKNFEVGMCNVRTQIYNPEEKKYEGDFIKWQGDTEISIEFNQEETKLASGNNIAWAVFQGALTGTVTLTLYGIKASDYQHLFACKYNKTYGAVMGGNNEAIYAGLYFETKANDGSTNRYILPMCTFKIPDISAQTIAEDENAVANLEVEATAYGIMDASNTVPYTCLKINSKENADGYTKFDEQFIVPDLSE